MRYADKKTSKRSPGSDEFNLLVLKDKLERLYLPQALNKNIRFTVTTSYQSELVPFSKNKLLQIAGNLVSNAIKFTPGGGKVDVKLGLEINEHKSMLQIQVKDSGAGLDEKEIEAILKGNAASKAGTTGEKGYGFGLALVKYLTESLEGSLHIYSKHEKGAVFEVMLPQQKHQN